MNNFFITIITERQTISISIACDDPNKMIMAANFVAVFSKTTNWGAGIFLGEIFQCKSHFLMSKLRVFIQNNGNSKDLWTLYDVISGLRNGEFFAIFTQDLNIDFQYVIKYKLLQLNNPCFDEFLKFKESHCQGIIDNYQLVHLQNGKQHIRIGEPERKKRICRYCGRMMPEVTFAKVAHTISEGLGNKSIITNDECDVCNETLGREIEQDLIAYLSYIRIFMSVTGKKGKNKIVDSSFAIFEDKPKSIKVNLYEQENPEMKHWSWKERDGKNFFSFSHPQKINRQDVYRAVVKYALGVMDVSHLIHFKETISWVQKGRSADNLPQLLFFIDNMPDKTYKPSITIFMRKNDDKTLPYSFVECYLSGVIILAILPFSDMDDRSFSDKEDFKHVVDILNYYKKLPFLNAVNPNNDFPERITFRLSFEKGNYSSTPSSPNS